MEIINIINFITSNMWEILVGLIIFIFVMLLINYRKQVKKKIKNESVSFIAMVFSISMALISFVSKPTPLPAEVLAIAERQGIQWAIPITLVFLVLTIIFAVIFFRKK